MTIWKPDTCDCKIEYNSSIIWIATLNKCRLHEKLNYQSLLDTVLSQNNRFNLSLGITTSQDERNIITKHKINNKIRIRTEKISTFREILPEKKKLLNKIKSRLT